MLNFKLTNHPAQARHPITEEPLFDDEGNPVPLFPDQHAIRLDEVIVGYCSKDPSKPVSLIIPSSQVTDVLRDDLTTFLRQELGGEPKKISAPPDRIEEDDEGYEECETSPLILPS